ncbi:MAG: hypothetical protein ACTHOG_12025 [Marmoricola sp.]
MRKDIDTFMAFYDATCDGAYRLALCYTDDAAVAGDALVNAYVRSYLSVPPAGRSDHVHLLALLREELLEVATSLPIPPHRHLEAS